MCADTHGARNVKYFMMGMSVILLLWVGTFVMMIE
ncbi:membrane protein YpdK [Buttiauxella gaviniae]|uniref:Membrane protein YpdK n=1 Tax=Buttiauxella gaviniae TaxID=82990 RepID=A0ABV3NQJ0_9ENTR